MAASDSLLHAFQTHYRSLFAFVARRADSVATAEDIVQDAFIKIACLSPSTTVQRPGPFFFRVVERLLLDRFRETGQRRCLSLDDPQTETLLEHAPGPEEWLAAEQTVRGLMAAIDTLPPRCRQIFVMRKVDGLPPEAIATQLGISRNMVEKHLRRALLTCQLALPRRAGRHEGCTR